MTALVQVAHRPADKVGASPSHRTMATHWSMDGSVNPVVVLVDPRLPNGMTASSATCDYITAPCCAHTIPNPDCRQPLQRL